MKSMRRNENGAAVIEFAILLLLLMPLLFGIIEYGFLWAQSHYVSQAAREGARAGARIAVYDPGSGTITNQTEVQGVVDASVNSCLEAAPFYAGQVDEIIDETSFEPTTELFGSENKPALRVSVTVNSAAIWTPVLWQLLSLLPPFDGEHTEITQLTDVAVFAISRH